MYITLERGKKMNSVVLVGRLTKNPVLKYTEANRTPVATFRIAVKRAYASSNGERGTDFVNIVAWRKLAELTVNYLEKGRLVGIEGRLQSRSYEDPNGKKVFVTEIVANSVQFLEKKVTKENDGLISKKEQEKPKETPYSNPFSSNYSMPKDDLPF